MWPIAKKVLGKFGLNPERADAPPAYVAILDGVLVSAQRTEVVLTLHTANTDNVAVAEVEAAVTAMNRGLANLSGKKCHLRVVWGITTGDGYVQEMHAAGLYKAGNWQQWVQDRADSITALGMPSRHVYLLVELESRSGSGSTTARTVTDAFGYQRHVLRDREAATVVAEAQRMQKRLSKSGIGCSLASPESIAWMIQREVQPEAQRRTAAPRGTIEGAHLVAINRSAVQPYSDHLQVMGDDGHPTAFKAVLTVTEFPERLPIPGTEWLLDLGSLMVETPDGYDEQLMVDTSIRFRVMPPHEARKTITSALEAANEQMESAAASGAPIATTELQTQFMEMQDVQAELSRDGLHLMEYHPRFTVTADTHDELRDRVAALQSHFSQIGIVAMVSAHEQRQAWLETLPGDTLRIMDSGHIGDLGAMTASLFWGGSDVGERSPAPIQGWKTGASPGFVRFNVLGAARRGDATVVGFFGVAGRGKSVAGAMQCIEAALMGAWTTILDFKGDLGGVTAVAKAYDLPGAIVQFTERDSGALDVLGVPTRAAITQAVRQFTIMADEEHRPFARSAALEAVTRVLKKHEEAGTREQASSWEAVQYLVTHDDPQWAKFGATLADYAQTPMGALLLGKRSGTQRDLTTPGVWNIQLPALQLREATGGDEGSDIEERASLAVLRAAIFTTVAMAYNRDLKALPKVLLIPEVHRLLNVPEGAAFLNTMARLGRAMNLHIIIDSQDATGVSANDGLVEQMSTKFVYQLRSEKQQAAAAKLLDLADTPETRRTIHTLAAVSGADSAEIRDEAQLIRKGHAIMGDYVGRAGTMQWETVTADVLAMMDTSAYAQGTPTEADTEAEDVHEMESVR